MSGVFRVSHVCLIVATVLAGGAEGRSRSDEPVAAAHVSALGGMVKRDGVIGGDVFFDVGHRGFRAILGVPLRFEPDSGLRREDWDERADYGRVVWEVSFSHPEKGVLLRVAPLAGYSLGVGNLVSVFYSTLDPDHWRTGFAGAYHGRPGGLDVFVDSVLDPQVLGARLHVRPLSFLHPDGVFGRLEVGATLAGDMDAPADYVLERGLRTLDAVGLPRVTREGVSAIGVDARWPVLRAREAEVVPFFAMAQAAQGSGWHAGLALDLRPGRRLRFGLQGDLRRLGAGYVAPYFDSLYMVDRWDLGGEPKVTALRLGEAPRRWGFGAGLTLGLDRVFAAYVLLDLDGVGRFTTLRAGASATLSRRVRLSLTYLSRGIPRFARVVSPDRVVFAVSCEVALSRFFTAFASYAHDPTVRRSGQDRGRYASSETVLGGIRFSFGYR